MKRLSPSAVELLVVLDDLEHFHRARLGADAAGDALGGGVVFQHHDLHRACLDALAAADALLLVDHVHALGVAGDGLVFAGAHALAALQAGIDLGLAVLLHDLDAGLARIAHLIERLRAGQHAAQAGHAANILLNRQLFHLITSAILCSAVIIHARGRIVNASFAKNSAKNQFVYVPEAQQAFSAKKYVGIVNSFLLFLLLNKPPAGIWH